MILILGISILRVDDENITAVQEFYEFIPFALCEGLRLLRIRAVRVRYVQLQLVGFVIREKADRARGGEEPIAGANARVVCERRAHTHFQWRIPSRSAR